MNTDVHRPDIPDPVARVAEAIADRYVLGREIGRGGMASVYLAYDIRHERNVALKLLHPDLATPLANDRFLEEIRIVARLHHPHIVPLLDSGEVGELVYYVMPYVEGSTLRQRLEMLSQLPVEEAVQLVRDVLSGLDYAHRQGIVHRDVKPENILLHEGEPLLTDFGIARAIRLAARDDGSEPGFAVGTPRYMSPEQASGETRVDGRSDQYSTACLLFELLAGRPPFAGPDSHAIIAERFTEPPPSVRTVRPDAPSDLDAILGKAMSLDPRHRFRSAAAFRAALGDVLGITDTRETVAVRMTRRAGSWHRATAILATATLLGLGLVGMVRAGHNLGSSPGATRLVVMPFTVHGCAHLDYLRDGMTDLLSRTLDGSASISTVDPFAVREYLAKRGIQASPGVGRAAASHFSARRYILGSIVGVGDRCQITATLYDTGRDPTERVSVDVHGAHELAGALNELSRALLMDALGEPLPTAPVATAGSGVPETSNADDERAEVSGRRHIRAGDAHAGPVRPTPSPG